MPENRDIERRKSDEIERQKDSLVQRSLDYLKEFEEQDLANVEELDLEGWDLHRAARENRIDIARALIDSGAEIEVRDYYCMTPLHWAAFWSAMVNNDKPYLEVARLLIEHGAEIDARTADSTTNKYEESCLNDMETLERRGLPFGMVPDIFGTEDWTPLHFAADCNSLEVARLLIEHGADIDARARNQYGVTPILGCVNRNPGLLREITHIDSLDVARLLIEHGANTDGIDLSWMDEQEDA